jgi:hypothetical protein
LLKPPGPTTTNPLGLPQDRNIVMKRNFLILLAFTSFAVALQASPTPTPSPKRASHQTSAGQKATAQEVARAANGWSYVKGEWIHPDGYKFVNGKVLRTTARPGKPLPKPPGKLALENTQMLPAKTDPSLDNSKTAAEKAAEIRQKNLTPTAAPQTGSHL